MEEYALVRLPLIPCSDGAGEVVEVGPGVTRVKVGDRVAGIFFQHWLTGDISVTKLMARTGRIGSKKRRVLLTLSLSSRAMNR